MFLTVHAATGIVIGQNISNPLLAFLIGFIIHYIFDIIPHGDTKVPKKYKNPIHIATAGLADLIILTAFIIFLFIIKIELLTPSILLAMLGSMLPDFLQAFYYIYRKTIFIKTQRIHEFLHDLISKKYEINFYLGLLFQISLLIFLTYIII